MVIHDKDNNEQNNKRIIILLEIMLIVIAIAAVYFIYTLVLNPQNGKVPGNTAISQSTDINGKPKHKKKKRKPKKPTNAIEQKAPANEMQSTKEETKGIEKKEPINKEKKELNTEKVKTTPSNEAVAGSETNKIEELVNVVTKKIKRHKSFELGAALNKMPTRNSETGSPFATSDKEIITVKELSFSEIQAAALKNSGRKNPFAKGDVKPTVEELLKSINDIKKQSAQKDKTAKKITSMPEIPTTKGNIIPPLDGKEKMPPPPDLKSTPEEDVASNIYLTGIIGDTAIFKINGKSKALQAGQNYEGIVVLSVSPRGAAIKINGKKVIKQLKD